MVSNLPPYTQSPSTVYKGESRSVMEHALLGWMSTTPTTVKRLNIFQDKAAHSIGTPATTLNIHSIHCWCSGCSMYQQNNMLQSLTQAAVTAPPKPSTPYTMSSRCITTSPPQIPVQVTCYPDMETYHLRHQWV